MANVIPMLLGILFGFKLTKLLSICYVSVGYYYSKMSTILTLVFFIAQKSNECVT